MNSKQATVKFSLNVHSSNSGEVWPMESRDNPKLDERIRESYYADEDEACVGFNIDSIEDLMEILKFYAGRPVRISLGVTVETPEISTHAALSEKWQRGTSASFRSMETEDLSPATAASKMIAIAHALSRWEKKNGLPNVKVHTPLPAEATVETEVKP
jgi:hypothetical protein